MSSRRTSSVPKDVFPRMLYCDSRCSQTLTGLSPALPGALLCNATRRLADGQRVILRQRVRGSVRAVRAVRNTWVFQTETRVVADVTPQITQDTWPRIIDTPLMLILPWEYPQYAIIWYCIVPHSHWFGSLSSVFIYFLLDNYIVL